MKTKNVMLVLLLLVGVQYAVQAQELKNRIEKSILEIKGVSHQIPDDKIAVLDGLADEISERMKNGGATLVFMDKTNDIACQLAMVWLRTGLVHYGLTDGITVESAGIETTNEPISGLAMLRKYGFGVGNTTGKGLFNYSVRYGSGNWRVKRKEINSLNLVPENTVKVYVEEGMDMATGKSEGTFKLLFPNPEVIPTEILYVASKVNDLMQTQKSNQ